MKRLILLLLALLPVVASAEKDFRSMLVEGKTWVYTYHHFNESTNAYDPNTHQVSYTVQGDTIINDRQYKKLYRFDYQTMVNEYYGAFREDEYRCVWQYDYAGNGEDFMICDFFCRSYPGYKIGTNESIVNINGTLLHRYLWRGVDNLYMDEDLEYPYIRGTTIGVEGVGLLDKGLVHYLYERGAGYSCDYEEFKYVWWNGISFSNDDFTAPNYIELTEDEQQFLARNNDFAFRLFRKVRAEGSTVLSPLSVTYALGMLNNGAAGQTQQEIYSVLGFDDVDAQNAFCLKMINELRKTQYVDPTTQSTIANTIFVNQGKGWQLQNDFSHTVNIYYYAYPSARDFYDGETLGAINDWAKSRTNGMIDEVLKEEEFNPDAVSYLLNAIYFKGLWKKSFDVEETREEVFDGKGHVPMMHKGEEIDYAENDLYQTVSLPFGNGTYQLHLFLPREGKTLDEMMEHLNGQNWQIKENRDYLVDLKMPRFEAATSQDLIEVMKDFGMTSAFSPTEADFTKMCVDNHDQNIYIEILKQVAKIKVNEQGTEAAAVTIEGNGGAMLPTANFHANRPFFYLINEQSTGIILFMGQYMGPENPENLVTFTQGQMATIILPTEPDASKGKYYRLDKCKDGQIIFEQELQPQARVPYIIIPNEDFSIDPSIMDLEGLSHDAVSIEGISFIGSYSHEEFSYQEGFYIDIIDTTPDCLDDWFGSGKAIVGPLRAYLQVNWDDPYTQGGTKDPQKIKEIVLHNHGTGLVSPLGETEEGVIFDLSGRRISTSQPFNFSTFPKGVYIFNGKKRMVK